jgi:hypothetical protein
MPHFWVSTLNYRNSRTPGNINTGAWNWRLIDSTPWISRLLEAADLPWPVSPELGAIETLFVTRETDSIRIHADASGIDRKIDAPRPSIASL